jgi:hypothetical protein
MPYGFLLRGTDQYHEVTTRTAHLSGDSRLKIGRESLLLLVVGPGLSRGETTQLGMNPRLRLPGRQTPSTRTVSSPDCKGLLLSFKLVLAVPDGGSTLDHKDRPY